MDLSVSRRAFWIRIGLVVALSSVPLRDSELIWYTMRLQFANRWMGELGERWIWVPAWGVTCFQTVWAIWVARLVLGYPILIGTLAAVGTALIWFFPGAQLLAHWAGVYVPASNPVLATFLSYGFFVAYRLSIREVQTWRQDYRSHLVTLLSHDLKNPLAQLSSQLGRLSRNYPALHSPLSELETTTQDLRSAIQGLLELVRVESRLVESHPVQTDLNRLIESTALRFEPLAAARKVVIERDLEPLFPLRADPDLLNRVLSNLVDNGLKFSPTGATLTLRSREIHDPSGVWAEVQIQDQGPGISTVEQAALFSRPLIQAEPESQPSRHGSGVGLYLSRYFLELQGGRIWLAATGTSGSCFAFRLPILSK